MFIPAFTCTTNAITSDFLSSISPGWVVMFLDSHRTVFTFLSWLDLLGVVLAFWISILKSSYYFKVLTHGFERHLESTSDRFKNMFVKKSLIRFFLRWSSLQRKEGQMRRARKKINALNVGRMTHWSSKGRYVLWLALVQPCADLS